jgi:hypothetical protein
VQAERPSHPGGQTGQSSNSVTTGRGEQHERRLKANKAAQVPVRSEDHHATRTGEDQDGDDPDMTAAVPSGGVSGLRGSWLRVLVSDPVKAARR